MLASVSRLHTNLFCDISGYVTGYLMLASVCDSLHTKDLLRDVSSDVMGLSVSLVISVSLFVSRLHVMTSQTVLRRAIY